MFPYLVAIILSVSVYFVSYRFNFGLVALRVTHFIGALPLILITGYKYIKVGTDTGSYVFYFNKVHTFSDVVDLSSSHGEFGYWFLTYIGRLITDSYFIIFLLCTLIITPCYLYSLQRFNLRTLSFVCLLLIGPYFFQLNGMRQAIAIAIFSISVLFIIEKKPVHYLISIFIGFMFHKSMIICLPLYFLFKDEIKPRKVGLIIFVFIALILSFEKFISIAASVDERYSSYGDKKDTVGGAVVISVNIILFGWFVLCRFWHKSMLATRPFDVLLTLYLLGVMVSLLSMILQIDPSGFLRISIYFIQLNMFLIPMSIYSFRDSGTQYFVMLGAIAVMFMYFYLTTSAFSNLVPYRFYGHGQI